MSKAARVLSVEALTDFRNSMIKFNEEARGALSGVDMELRRMRDWLERDQLGYWQMQVKRRSEEVMNARTELARRKIAAQGSDTISDTEQKEKLREAMRRLRIAEEKVALVKRLIPVLHHTIAEYKSCASPLADHLSGGMEKSIHRIGAMVKSLEGYLALRAPTAPSAEAPGGSGASSGSSASAGGSARTGGVSESTPADGQAAPAAAGERQSVAAEAETVANPS
ncbi:hypothetical protein [Paludisphaera borealis]|uniref:Uncharacterized protein n=1 Tax=Paludisphaera borealis TaxID=1387353 RepID=A0A1U7CIE7_9BACT|nr:hypothetical protein [Paludisphaera borealis]APW58678.1 hypothetical protein BSF38_00078 [Paludisphaera borealis]